MVTQKREYFKPKRIKVTVPVSFIPMIFHSDPDEYDFIPIDRPEKAKSGVLL